MILGSERLGELVREQIIANKKGVDAYELTTNQAISQPASQKLKSLQTGAKVLGAIPRTIREVSNFPVDIRGQRSVILDHHHPGSEMLETFPSIVGVLVDIERKQIKLRRHAKLGKQSGNILPGNVRDQPLQAAVQEVGPIFQGPKEAVSSIDPESVPALGKQKCGVVFAAGSDPDFRKGPVGGPYSTKNLMNDAIFPILRTNLRLVAQQSLWVSITSMIVEPNIG